MWFLFLINYYSYYLLNFQLDKSDSNITWLQTAKLNSKKLPNKKILYRKKIRAHMHLKDRKSLYIFEKYIKVMCAKKNLKNYI